MTAALAQMPVNLKEMPAQTICPPPPTIQWKDTT
jgi:hypothetical protein